MFSSLADTLLPASKILNVVGHIVLSTLLLDLVKSNDPFKLILFDTLPPLRGRYEVESNALEPKVLRVQPLAVPLETIA
jgi:hypothetical protein